MTVYECAIHWKTGAEDYYNVIHYDITGDEPLDLQDLTDEFRLAFVSDLATIIAPAVAFQDITYRLDIAGSVGTTITPTLGAATGAAADNQYAGQLAALVRKKTNGTVRPVQGRVFVPGVSSEGLDSNGGWTATVQNALETFWDGVILIPFAGNGQAEMLIKASNPAAPNTNAYNSVAEMTAVAIPSALQSRKKGRGA